MYALVSYDLDETVGHHEDVKKALNDAGYASSYTTDNSTVKYPNTTVMKPNVSRPVEPITEEVKTIIKNAKGQLKRLIVILGDANDIQFSGQS